jgi:hypothetical protein
LSGTLTSSVSPTSHTRGSLRDCLHTRTRRRRSSKAGTKSTTLKNQKKRTTTKVKSASDSKAIRSAPKKWRTAAEASKNRKTIFRLRKRIHQSTGMTVVSPCFPHLSSRWMLRGHKHGMLSPPDGTIMRGSILLTTLTTGHCKSISLELDLKEMRKRRKKNKRRYPLA